MSTGRPTVYVSGLYSGPNPSPGLGTARSLRESGLDLGIVGVDYSNRSSGLHWPGFDEIILQRPWAELELISYLAWLQDRIEDGALWISGLDLEAWWLSEELPHVAGLLVPPHTAAATVRKPARAVATAMGFACPRTMTAAEPDGELARFCRESDWRVWVKGPEYQAVLARSWREVQTALGKMAATWSDPGAVLLQSHVAGGEESIAFAAYRGRLLGAVHMQKRDVTPEGKTWSGQIHPLDDAHRTTLERVVRSLDWTGGGEIEFVRDADDRLHLLEVNPRFPAWIFGATLAGTNLPARLVAAALGDLQIREGRVADEFVRTVWELPRRDGYPLAEPEVPEDAGPSDGKHPSGMPQLARRVRGGERRSSMARPPEPILELDEITEVACATPTRVFLERSARQRMDRVASLLRSKSDVGVEVVLAYSMKTDPDPRLIALARDADLWIEAISELEVRAAIDAGIPSEHVVLNGPGKGWPRQGTARLGATFADSAEELERIVKSDRARVIGPRLRAPGSRSRFGIDADRYEALLRAASTVARLPAATELGVHFHLASSAIGARAWRGTFEAMVHFARSLQLLAKRPVTVLDVGGGWSPGDLEATLPTILERDLGLVRSQLPDLRTVIAEIGKGIAQPTFALASRVIEVRERDGHVDEVVVDASIAELPEARSFPHRVAYRPSAARGWLGLPKGDGRVLGRLCMEDDVLAENVAIPHELKRDDIIVFADAGAYDHSMAYEFGRG